MKKYALFMCIILGLGFSLSAQETPDAALKDTSYWTSGGVASIGFSNTGYSTYWQAGALPSQAVSGRLNLFANYKKKSQWTYELALAYGLLRQGREGVFLKNEDRIEFTSKYGAPLAEKLLIAAQLNFRSQFDEGFEFNPAFPTNEDSATLISRFLSPAYLNFGVGIDYQPSENLSFYYTPVNAKITIVADENLRPNFIPQEITTGPARFELGSNLTVKLKQEVVKNVLFQSTANFFANYLENFGNIDVNWETLTTMKVNDFLAVSFATNLIYDDDILFAIDRNGDGTPDGKGPRTQFQHILTVGLTLNFKE